MQISERLSVTQTSVVCSSCGEIPAAEVRAHRRSICRHASAAEVRRILALLEERHRRRERPMAQVLRTVASANHNGSYEISVLPDGTFACTCLSFLGSRGLQDSDVREGVRAATCKHIREQLSALSEARAALNRLFGSAKAPSDWQKLVLRAMSIEPHATLTNAQAYVAIDGLLKRQGVNYLELEDLMKRQRKVTILPINAFGIEWEGVGIPRAELARALTEGGIPTASEAYGHQLRDSFKVVTDASVQGSHPFELVSPKLFGADGMKTIDDVCRIVHSRGGSINSTCGLHVHVDAWNLEIAEAKILAKLWSRIHPVVQFLVPPSRRTNGYCLPFNEAELAEILAMRQAASLSRLNRYHSLNLNAFSRHGTVEYRFHGGTWNAEKVRSWTIFVLLVTAAARKGIDPEGVPVTWPGVAEAIGLTTGTSVIRRAYRYLTERHAFFSQQAGASAPPTSEAA